jgi:hypothetical protein
MFSDVIVYFLKYVAVMELYQSLLNYYFGDCFAKTCNQFKPTKKQDIICDN